MAATEIEAWMERLIEALRTPVPSEELAALHEQPFGPMIFRAPALDDERALNRATRAAAEALVGLEDPYNACRLGYVVGVLVEQGADANHLADELAHCLSRMLQLARPLLPDAEDRIPDAFDALDHQPFAARALLGLRDLSLAVMSALCRAKGARQRVREWPEFRRDLEELSFPNAFYLRELLNCADDIELIVLHPQQSRGYRVITQMIRNNFHLFSMLQAELIGERSEGLLEGPELDPAMIAYMRGETHERPGDSDWAVWHFGNARAWTAQGYETDLLSTSIWGEQSPRDVPMVDGERIVVLGECPLRSKTWDANFIAPLHDAHEARLWVRTLTVGEVESWLKKLVEAQGGPGPGARA